MPVYDNQQGITATASPVSKGNAWASASAAVGKAYQLIGFSGGNSSTASQVEVLFGTTQKLNYWVGSSMAISEFFGTDGPVTATNEKLVVHTKIKGNSANLCYANLLYRIVL